MHVLEDLAARGKLLCPGTRRPAGVRGGRLVSPEGDDLGAVTGPLNFLRTFRDTLAAGQVPAAFVERVRTHLELPAGADGEIAAAIAASGARFEESHLSAEARVLAERFGMPAFEFGLAQPPDKPAPQAEPAPARLQYVRDYVGERLTAGREVLRSVRVRNAGPAPALAEGGGAIRIDARWQSAQGRDVPEAATTTALPADIEPGREITLILRLRAPAACGPHRLQICAAGPAGDGARIAELPVEVIACELPVFDYAYHPGLLEYGPDHHAAAIEVIEFIKERYGDRRICALEIGGGVTPTGHSVAAHGHRVVSTDISHAQSILGELYFRHRLPYLSESLAFVSCDGIDLPFADATFDGVMFFAAFHHFADPHAALEEAKRVTAADGFIYLGCENCVPNPADGQYREELRRGINEQMWTLAEMDVIVRRAGLRVARARVDFHSLKAVLVRP